MNNADIEKTFQSDPTSSFTFHIGAETFEIKFKGVVFAKTQIRIRMEDIVFSAVRKYSFVFDFLTIRDATGGQKQEEEGCSSATLPAEASRSRVSLDSIQC